MGGGVRERNPKYGMMGAYVGTGIGGFDYFTLGFRSYDIFSFLFCFFFGETDSGSGDGGGGGGMGWASRPLDFFRGNAWMCTGGGGVLTVTRAELGEGGKGWGWGLGGMLGERRPGVGRVGGFGIFLGSVLVVGC